MRTAGVAAQRPAGLSMWHYLVALAVVPVLAIALAGTLSSAGLMKQLDAIRGAYETMAAKSAPTLPAALRSPFLAFAAAGGAQESDSGPVVV